MSKTYYSWAPGPKKTKAKQRVEGLHGVAIYIDNPVAIKYPIGAEIRTETGVMIVCGWSCSGLSQTPDGLWVRRVMLSDMDMERVRVSDVLPWNNDDEKGGTDAKV